MLPRRQRVSGCGRETAFFFSSILGYLFGYRNSHRAGRLYLLLQYALQKEIVLGFLDANSAQRLSYPRGTR